MRESENTIFVNEVEIKERDFFYDVIIPLLSDAADMEFKSFWSGRA